MKSWDRKCLLHARFRILFPMLIGWLAGCGVAEGTPQTNASPTQVREIKTEVGAEAAKESQLASSEASDHGKLFTYPDPSTFRSFGAYEPDISNDGNWVVYMTQVPGGKSSVHVIDVRTSAEIEVESGLQGVYFPKWSPNSDYLAYLGQDGEFKDGFRLRVWDRKSKQVKQVHEFVGCPPCGGGSIDPEWTADSRWVIFKARAGGGAPQATAGAAVSGANEITISRSRWTRFTPAGWKAPVLEQEKRGFLREAVLSEIIAVDPSSLETVVLAKGGYLYDQALSPDGKLLFVSRYQGIAEGDNSVQAVFVVRVPDRGQTSRKATEQRCEGSSNDSLCDYEGKVAAPLATKVPAALGSRVVWSPNGRYLSYSTSGSAAVGDFFVIDVKTAQVRNLTEHSIPPSEHSQTIPEKLRDFGFSMKVAAREPFQWSPDSSAIYVNAREEYAREATLWVINAEDGSARRLLTGDIAIRSLVGIRGSGKGDLIATGYLSPGATVGLFSIDPETGRTQPVDQSLALNVTSTGNIRGDVFNWRPVGCQGECLLIKKESYSQPPDLWLYRFDTARMARLTTLNPSLANVEVPRSRVLRSVDNSKAVGLLTLPEHLAAAKYPLVVSIYGGGFVAKEPAAYAGGYLRDIVHERRVLGRGYALLQVDSWIEGYGSTCQQISSQVEAAVEAAIATGRIDADRMGIYGYSFGGYSVNCVITRPNHFRAAVAGAGLSDLVSMSLGSASLEVGQARVGGSLWEFPERYVDQSPVFHLDKVNCPLLLVHAVDDLTVPLSQAEEMYYGLETLGKEVMLVRYPPRNRHAFPLQEPSYWPRILDWFDFYLHPQPANSAAAQHPTN